MPALDYIHCVENQPTEDRTISVPGNENAPEHLHLQHKPLVNVIKDISKEDLLKLCAVPVIEPLVLATLFIQFWKEVYVTAEEWISFGLLLSRREGDKYLTSLKDLFEVREIDYVKAEGTNETPPTLDEVLYFASMQFRLSSYVGSEYKEYLTEMKNKMLTLGKSPPYKIQSLHRMSRYEGITENENLQTVIAGVDMFLMKHKNSVYKLLRVGTISLRLKVCGF